MNNSKVIRELKKYLKDNFFNESSGHDWWHSLRVWKMSKLLAKYEGGDLFIIEVAALLHDVADWKFYGGDTYAGGKRAKVLLEKLSVDPQATKQICEIIDNVSFKGAGVKDKMSSIEGKIVQDADRLDVLGAIGIARVFAYGGNTGRQIYNPEIKPKLHQTFAEYQKSNWTSFNHFYEKILLVKDRIHTKTAKKIAVKRHQFVKNYLKEFLREWRVD